MSSSHFPIRFRLFDFMLRPLIHLELRFIFRIVDGDLFFILILAPICFVKHHFLKMLFFFPSVCVWIICQNLSVHGMWSYIQVSNSISIINMPFYDNTMCLYNYSSVLQCEFWDSNSSSSPFFFSA